VGELGKANLLTVTKQNAFASAKALFLGEWDGLKCESVGFCAQVLKRCNFGMTIPVFDHEKKP